MRVMIVLPNMSTQIEAITGGVLSATMNLLRGFAEMGEPEVLLVSISEEVKEPHTIQFAPNCRIYYMPEGPFPFSTLNYFFFSVGRMRKLVKEFKPSLIHYQIGGTLLFTRWASMFSVPHLITIHGIPSGELKVARGLRQWLEIFINGVIGEWLYPKNIIQISAYSRDLFKKLKTDHTCVIPNAMPERCESIPLKEKMTNHLAFVAAIKYIKNQSFMLDVLYALKQEGIIYTIEFCGGFTTEEYRREMEAKVEKFGLADQVKFNGWVAYSEMPAVLERTDMLVMSSRQETLPMAIAEAMAAGRPVMASRAGAVPEMIEDGVTGFLIDIDTVENAVAVLKSVYNNPDKMRAMGEQAKRKARENYQARSVAVKTLAFYEEILSGQPAVQTV
jgi:glycosyltransferase involved in cell wall biosynthesis